MPPWNRFASAAATLEQHPKRVAFLVFLCVWFTHFGFIPYPVLADTTFNIPTAISIYYEGNIELSEYNKLFTNPINTQLIEINGQYYNEYPLGPSLFALPFVAAADWFSHYILGLSLQTLALTNHLTGLGVLTASFAVAATSALLYLIVCRSLKMGPTLILIFIFSYCTVTWSVVTRGLWQHGPAMLMLTLTTYLLMLHPRQWWSLFIAGLAMGFSFIIRPTSAVPIVIFSLYVLLRETRSIFFYIAGGLLMAIPFFAFNIAEFNAFLTGYYSISNVLSFNTFGEAFLGLLFSPNRGLFIFSPILLFSVPGIYLKVRDHSFRILDTVILACVLTQLILISMWPVWWGGHTFGPRLLSETIPFLVYFIVPVMQRAPEEGLGPRQVQIIALIFGVFMLTSFYIQFQGVANPGALMWNVLPENVNQHPERLWDWGDIQFLR